MGKIIHQPINSRTDFFYYAFRNILLVSLPLVVIAALVLSLPHSSATSSGTDNIQMVLSTSCTVNAVVTSEHTVSLNGGQLDNNVGNTKLSAYCNDNNGYGIYAIGSSGDVDGNTDLINSSNEYYNIRTGIYDSNNPVNPSSWAMKLTAGSGSGIDPVTGNSVPATPPTIMNGYDNYSAIPSNYTLVANRTSGTSMTTDTSISGSYLSTTYQIYANSAQPSGTYNGKVKYVMIHPSSNSQNTINGSFNIAFLKAGKNPAYQDSSGNYYFAMQDMTSEICNSITETGETTAAQLVDKRDNKLYWIAKLADGHCWMTQNLDFNLVAYTDVQGQEIMKSLTSEDTDLTDHSLTGAYSQANGYSYDESTGIITWTPASTAITSNHIISGTNVPNWYTSTTAPYSAEGGDTYYYTSNSTANDTKYNSLSECTSASHTTSDCQHYHAGNYYNWTAAIASNNSDAITSGDAANSICPKGWRLPTNTGSEFANLLVAQGVINNITDTTYTENGLNIIRTSPLYFTRSGSIDASLLLLSGSTGYSYSGTIGNNSAYFLRFDKDTIKPANNVNGYGKSNGMSIRCIAK